jgi:hypothetical protein
MAYYVRAFCTGAPVPELYAIQHWLRTRDSRALLEDPTHAVKAARAQASRASGACCKNAEMERRTEPTAAQDLLG